jgi:superfamily I DNA and RNA helicase
VSLKIIPNDIQNLEPGEKRILNKINSLYSGVDYDCFLYVQPRLKKLNPDFLLIDAYKGICIIEVKDWDRGYIKQIDYSYVIDVKDRRINNPVFKTNQYFNFAKRILQSEPFFIDEKGDFNLKLYSKVIFLNMNSKEIESLNPYVYQPPTECISSEQIRALSFDTLFSSDTRFLDENTISMIRGTLFPEIRVKPIQTELWQFNRKNPLENLIISTLDAEQEKFARKIPYGHYMITGIPGSGKTVILLSRAIHLIKENPTWKIRILTYNRSLARKMQNKFESLHEKLELMKVNYQNITISTFHSLASEVSIRPPPPIRTKEYWDIILPFEAIESAEPTYDAILIDEYQDFPDSWIKLCLLMCKKYDYNGQQTENLFLAGDRLQSIYNDKDSSWKSLGVNIVGRSKLLKTSYRSGSTHINLALDYLMKDEKLKKEVEKFYEGRNGICCSYEVENNVDFISGGMENINGYLNDLFLTQKYNPEDVLVLVPNRHGPNNMDEIYQKLDIQLQSISIASKEIEPNKMTVTTYHSSKGLECKVCILLNVGNLNDKKLLYVGMTRASEKLCIHSFKPDEGKIFKELLACYEEMMAPIKNDTLSYKILNDLDMYDKTPSSIENIRKEHPNAYKAWGKKEELELINLYKSGKSIEEIAESLGRQYGGIKSRLKKLGLISDDVRPIKNNVNVETKYPIKSEHLIEPDLWKEEDMV